MCIAYVDPGNLEGDLNTGAKTKYSLLWLVFWSTFMGFIIQMLAAKLGVVTRKNLAELCREQYPVLPRILLWIMAEVAIVGSDIQEVIGSAIAIFLLSNGAVPLWAGVLITATDTFLFLFIERFGVRKLEAFFSFCVTVMCAMFGGLAFKADIPAGEAIKGFLVPALSRRALEPAMEMVGAIIMPHNIFLHSALVQSRAVDSPDKRYKREAVFYFGCEAALSLLATVFINCCVVAVFAKGFYREPDEAREVEIGLTTAGDQLRKAFGPAAYYLFALGLLAAGQSSTMTGTYTGQFVMSGFLNLRVTPAKRVFITRLVAIGPTILVALLYRDSTSLDRLNQKLNLLQAVQLPFALLPLIYITSSPQVMGDFVNSRPLFVACLLICGACITLNMTVTITIIDDIFDDHWYLVIVGIGLICAYITFIIYLAVGPQRWRAFMGYIIRKAPCCDAPPEVPASPSSSSTVSAKDPENERKALIAAGYPGASGISLA